MSTEVAGVDLDLAQVRAFVATADELHFGRAAEGLYLSQQALSKRIARLEEALGVRLFDRTGHSVTLTDAGKRFLGPARELLVAGDRAVEAAREDARPLRLDVWGALFYPMRSVRQVIDADPDLRLVVGIRRFATVAAGFQRDELDVAFGRVPVVPAGPAGSAGSAGPAGPTGSAGPAGDDALPDTLTHRLVRLDPIGVVVSERHPMAGAGSLTPDDLRRTRLWFPAPLAALDFMRSFVTHFGLEGDFGDANLGIDYFVEHLREDAARVSLLPRDIPLPRDSGVRMIPLIDPVPLYAWSLVWRRYEQHPLLEPLLETFGRVGRLLGWMEYDPARHWLPGQEASSAQS
jgi:DNA-binding transcriptional LysR family regulator